MLNQVIVVGRLTSDPEVNEVENNRKEIIITIAVPRSYKNADGMYDTDFVKCTLWNGIAEKATEYCKKGDIIAVKGKLETKNIDGKYELQVIAEKVTFLSSKKPEESKEE